MIGRHTHGGSPRWAGLYGIEVCVPHPDVDAVRVDAGADRCWIVGIGQPHREARHLVTLTLPEGQSDEGQGGARSDQGHRDALEVTEGGLTINLEYWGRLRGWLDPRQ